MGRAAAGSPPQPSRSAQSTISKARLVPEFDGVAVLEWGIPPDLIDAFENLIYNAIKYSHPGGTVTVY